MYLLLRVGLGCDDQQTVKKIRWYAMWRLIIGPANVGYATVGGDDEDWGHLILKGTVEEGEALNVKHVHLINEEHTWYYLSLPLLPPFPNFCVYLLSHLCTDLAGVSSEERKEALGPAGSNTDKCYITCRS